MPRATFDLHRLADRLWSHVDVQEGWDCWEFLGYRNPQSDYGQISLNAAEREHFSMARVVTAPVLSCTLNLGPAPEGYVVLHSCDWPPCCNPHHLRWGTKATNNREAWARGRQASGERHHRARYSDAEVADVLARARAGEPVRSLAEAIEVDWSTIYSWLRGEGRGAR